MLNAGCLLSKVPLEDPHAYIVKLRAVCKSCMGRLDLDMGHWLATFPSITEGEAAIRLTELPNNSYYT